MTSGSPDGIETQSNGQVLPEHIAELASEMSEAAEDKPRRQRLGQQIVDLAGRSRSATQRGVQSGGQAAWHRLQSGGGAAARRVKPATDAAARRVRPATDAAARRVRPATDAATRGFQAGAGSASRQGAKAAGNLARTGSDLARRGGDLARRTGDLARKSGVASGSATARRGRAVSQWLTTQTLEMAPKIPIRSAATLRAQYPDRDTEALADGLISGAARASASLGAAVGAAAAVPFIPTTPGDLVVETLGVIAIELKLVAELHEVYGMPAEGTARQRMTAYIGSWADRRGVSVTANGLALAVGSPLRRKLERRLLVRAGQSAIALAPLLAGAAAGAYIDHRETRKLGHQVRADLRKRADSFS
jgi:hypothetical protein